MTDKDPASLESQIETENEIDKVLIALSVSILAVIARRLGKLEGVDPIGVFTAANYDMAEIQQIIKRGNKALESTIKAEFKKMGAGNDKWAAAYYKAAGVDQLSFKANETLKAILYNGLDDALIDARKFVNSNALGIVDRYGKYKPLRDAYLEIVGESAVQMSTGAITSEQAISKAVKTLSNSGVRVKYPNTTRELYSAVRMNVMDSYSRAMVDMRMYMGQEFGADGVEVTAHVPCAPDHEPYQGRQFSYEAWNNLQSSLSRQLVYGANCHHRTYPVILGVSSALSYEQRQSMRTKSHEKVTVTGLSGKKLTMTRYEASQYQRRVETSIRKMNENAYLLEQANLTNFAKMEEQTIRKHMAEYRRISKQAGLPAMVERTKSHVL